MPPDPNGPADLEDVTLLMLIGEAEEWDVRLPPATLFELCFDSQYFCRPIVEVWLIRTYSISLKAAPTAAAGRLLTLTPSWAFSTRKN